MYTLQSRQGQFHLPLCSILLQSSIIDMLHGVSLIFLFPKYSIRLCEVSFTLLDSVGFLHEIIYINTDPPWLEKLISPNLLYFINIHNININCTECHNLSIMFYRAFGSLPLQLFRCLGLTATLQHHRGYQYAFHKPRKRSKFRNVSAVTFYKF